VTVEAGLGDENAYWARGQGELGGRGANRSELAGEKL